MQKLLRYAGDELFLGAAKLLEALAATLVFAVAAVCGYTMRIED